jgi:hypothetical protein
VRASARFAAVIEPDFKPCLTAAWLFGPKEVEERAKLPA